MFDNLKQEVKALKDDKHKAIFAIDIVIGKVEAEQLKAPYLFVTDVNLTKGTFDNMSKAINKLNLEHGYRLVSLASTGQTVHAVLTNIA